MKKIKKSPPPNLLTNYKEVYPDASWECFRNHNCSEDYKSIRQVIFNDQGGICAYCEVSIPDQEFNQQRIEHFHPKSDTSNLAKNWALDWQNIFGVCLGGENEGKKHQLPANLSCDSAKKGRIYDGNILNPLQTFAFPCLFYFNKRTGKLTVNEDKCIEVTFKNNNYSTTSELVTNTIEVLNLNCDRLNKQRLAVLYEYTRIINNARQKDNKQIFTQLAESWFQQEWKPFLTVRRILLGNHAERKLTSINYDG